MLRSISNASQSKSRTFFRKEVPRNPDAIWTTVAMAISMDATEQSVDWTGSIDTPHTFEPFARYPCPILATTRTCEQVTSSLTFPNDHCGAHVTLLSCRLPVSPLVNPIRCSLGIRRVHLFLKSMESVSHHTAPAIPPVNTAILGKVRGPSWSEWQFAQQLPGDQPFVPSAIPTRVAAPSHE